MTAEFAERAAATGARLITAFGYDYVPGNLAGALAARRCRRDGAAGPQRRSSATVSYTGFGLPK